MNVKKMNIDTYALCSSFIALACLCCGLTSTKKNLDFLFGHTSTLHTWILLEKKNKVLNYLLTKNML